MIVHQFSTRQRLRQANGNADNHVMLVGGAWGFTEEEPDLGEIFRQMDAWLMGIANDRTDVETPLKVVGNKPSSLNDACWDNTNGEHLRLEQPQTYMGTSRCNELYPAYPTPRHIAGAPLANNIVSCRLRALNPADYTVAFSDEQWSELRTAFPEGVCDWSFGDASEARYQGTWLSFGPSPVNRL